MLSKSDYQRANANFSLYPERSPYWETLFENINCNILQPQPTAMNNEEIREYGLSKPGVTEGFPFNDTALVFKVAGKMFALLDLSEESRGISLKCDPELAIELYPFLIE